MELTREDIERLTNYDPATDGDTIYMDEFVAKIAKQLLAEMDKPKVWEGAPEKAERAFVIFSDKSGINKLGEITYTRTLPKSRIDEIAEEEAGKEFEVEGESKISTQGDTGMRVSNERAQGAIKAHHITGNLTNIVKDYAADLLEAREIIKEMRSKLLVGGIQATEDMTMYRSKPVDTEIIRDLIKRTKDYAE